jgi:hypothetical protein
VSICALLPCAGTRCLKAAGSAHRVVGGKLQEHRGACRLSYPMEHGIVTDWQDMERLWQHVYGREQLAVASEEHPVRAMTVPWHATWCVDPRPLVPLAGPADGGAAQPPRQP